jgi:Protein of unknown function (DUF3102)
MATNVEMYDKEAPETTLHGEVIPPGSSKAVADWLDYSSLSPEIQSEARATAARIRERTRASILDTGRDLLAIKEKLEHGAFGRWIEAEFGMTERTAQNYMAVASTLGDKSEIVSLFPPTTVYRLAAKSTPNSVREEVIKRVKAGERPDPDEVADAIRAAKESKRGKAKPLRLPDHNLPHEGAKEECTEALEKQDAREADHREEVEFHTSGAVDFLVSRLSPEDLCRFAALYREDELSFGRVLSEKAAEIMSKTTEDVNEGMVAKPPMEMDDIIAVTTKTIGLGERPTRDHGSTDPIAMEQEPWRGSKPH